MYVCMYVCMYVSTYLCMYVCMYVSIYVCMYMFFRLSRHIGLCKLVGIYYVKQDRFSCCCRWRKLYLVQRFNAAAQYSSMQQRGTVQCSSAVQFNAAAHYSSMQQRNTVPATVNLPLKSPVHPSTTYTVVAFDTALPPAVLPSTCLHHFVFLSWHDVTCLCKHLVRMKHLCVCFWSATMQYLQLLYQSI
jgi:hypothetical protein